MYRTYQVLFNRLLMCLDALIVIASFAIAWWLKFDSGWIPHQPNHTIFYYRSAIIFAVVIFVISNAVVGLYRPMRAKSVFLETYNIGKSLALGMLVFMAALYFVKMQEFPRDVIVIFAVAFMVLTLIERLSIRYTLRALRRRGLNQRYMLVVGWSQGAERFIEAIEEQPWFGYRVIGCLHDGDATGSEVRDVPIIGRTSDIGAMLAEHLIDQVIIAMPRHSVKTMGHVIDACEAAGIQSMILPDYFDLLPARPRFETFGDIPLIDTRYVPLDDAMNAALKRGFDVTFSAAIMVVLLPLFLPLCLAVRLSSDGPVLFVQERVGKNRRTFKMYKFRTMLWDEPLTADEREVKESTRTRDLGWTVKDDHRRTRIGSFLRKTSLDELPQFWNVFIGDMSVIGPRPERPIFVDQFRSEIPRYMVKHRVRPGITGWAQVHGWRGDTSILERIQFDLEYIENWSFWMDMRIVWRTIKDGLVHENAY